MNKLILGIIAVMVFVLSAETAYMYVLTKQIQSLPSQQKAPKPSMIYIAPDPQPVAI